MVSESVVSESVVADVEVSIVSLRGGSQLSRCVATLPRACAGLSWRLTLVDNSPSGLALTPSLHGVPAAATLRSEGRRGFAANQNLVLTQVVREDRARYVLVLNDDTELDTRSVTTLVRYADERPHTGAVGPVLRDSNGARSPSIFAWPTLTNQVLSSAFPRRQPRPVAEQGWINGACLLVRTAALAQVGLFDPQYFLFYEETDLCRRMTRAGWRIEQCANATVVHRQHQTTKRTGSAVEIDQQMLRSRYLYFRKHRGRLAARMLNGLVRCGLFARTAKVAVETAAGRKPSGSPTAGVLWALTASQPSRPTRFELEARANSAPARGAPHRTACRIGRS